MFVNFRVTFDWTNTGSDIKILQIARALLLLHWQCPPGARRRSSPGSGRRTPALILSNHHLGCPIGIAAAPSNWPRRRNHSSGPQLKRIKDNNDIKIDFNILFALPSNDCNAGCGTLFIFAYYYSWPLIFQRLIGVLMMNSIFDGVHFTSANFHVEIFKLAQCNV